MAFRSILLVVAACTAAAACGDDDAGDDDVTVPDGAPAADAPMVDCVNMPTLSFGKCELPDGGACNGQLGENGTFVPITAGEVLQPVVGFQGSDMFVIGIAAEGIELGTTPSERPRATAQLLHGDTTIATFNGTPDFYADDTNPERMLAPSLFLIVVGPAQELVDETILARADLTDHTGAYRCGEVTFVAGELIVPP